LLVPTNDVRFDFGASESNVITGMPLACAATIADAASAALPTPPEVRRQGYFRPGQNAVSEEFALKTSAPLKSPLGENPNLKSTVAPKTRGGL